MTTIRKGKEGGKKKESDVRPKASFFLLRFEDEICFFRNATHRGGLLSGVVRTAATGTSENHWPRVASNLRVQTNGCVDLASGHFLL